MALFAVNTGCREAVVCALQWDWEVSTPGVAGGSVFIVPKHAVKNREERLVVLNDIARDVVEACRGQHEKYVFTYRGSRLQKINQGGWRDARKRAKLEQVRVHDLKHTFGRRLRAAGVSFEDRQDLLGHKSGRITTHYSAAELGNLFDAANKVCKETNGSYPTLTILKREKATQPISHAIDQRQTRKSPARLFVVNG
jgi:integrase